MNKEEIREQGKYHYASAPAETTQLVLADMLTEIAAHLAEVNDHLKCIDHPLIEVVDASPRPQEERATLRDEIAMRVLGGYMGSAPTNLWGEIREYSEVSARAYTWADAMLEARKK